MAAVPMPHITGPIPLEIHFTPRTTQPMISTAAITVRMMTLISMFSAVS